MPTNTQLHAISYRSDMLHGYVRENVRSPVVAPPMHVAFRLPVGHAARAALTQASHFILEMLILAFDWVACKANLADPLTPSVRDDMDLSLQP